MKVPEQEAHPAYAVYIAEKPNQHGVPVAAYYSRASADHKAAALKREHPKQHFRVGLFPRVAVKSVLPSPSLAPIVSITH